MNKFQKRELITKINETRIDHKKYIKDKFFTPILFDKNQLQEQYKIIDIFYNRIVKQIKYNQ